MVGVHEGAVPSTSQVRLSHQHGFGFDCAFRNRTDACIFDAPNHSHLIDWRLIQRLSANVLSSFCKQECAELVVFGTGCRSTASSNAIKRLSGRFLVLSPLHDGCGLDTGIRTLARSAGRCSERSGCWSGTPEHSTIHFGVMPVAPAAPGGADEDDPSGWPWPRVAPATRIAFGFDVAR